MKAIAKIMTLMLAATIFAGCSSMQCEDCGNTPTKGYKNENTGENEYYCSDCSSDCNLCGDDADKHYIGGGGIIFICNDCYDELKSYGWVS